MEKEGIVAVFFGRDAQIEAEVEVVVRTGAARPVFAGEGWIGD
jgi:hypothetical protein